LSFIALLANQSSGRKEKGKTMLISSRIMSVAGIKDVPQDVVNVSVWDFAGVEIYVRFLP
jgi:hypothetical protein